MDRDPERTGCSMDGGLCWVDLTAAERVVIWAMRTRLEGAPRLAEVREGFCLGCDDGLQVAALSAFEGWFLMIAVHCSRDLYLHRACCPRLSLDELVMLELVASQQQGRSETGTRLADMLVQAAAADPLLHASKGLAWALRRLGLHLPDRRAASGTTVPSGRLH